MERNTRLQNAIETAEDEARLDASAGKILAEPFVLANFAKGTMPWLHHLPLAEIVPMLGDVRLRQVPLFPDVPSLDAAITDKTKHEGTVSFDVLTELRMGMTERQLRFYINFEAQGRSLPWNRVTFSGTESPSME